MTKDLAAKMRRLFPECEVTADGIQWHGGEPYISAYRKDDMLIDGSVTREQLLALAEWMNDG